METLSITMTVNGASARFACQPNETLLDVLRDQAQLTGAKHGCDTGACGACTVHLDGKPVCACLCLAASCDGRKVTTIECGGPDAADIEAAISAFARHDALQCGYCTPGMVMMAVAAAREGPDAFGTPPTERLSGNLCRCAAYQNIKAAVAELAGTLARR